MDSYLLARGARRNVEHKVTSVIKVRLFCLLVWCGGIKACQKAGCTIGRTWQGWEGGAQGHVLVESLLVVYLYMKKLSLIDAQKTAPAPVRG
jgi:hypothetical protein